MAVPELAGCVYRNVVAVEMAPTLLVESRYPSSVFPVPEYTPTGPVYLCDVLGQKYSLRVQATHVPPGRIEGTTRRTPVRTV